MPKRKQLTRGKTEDGGDSPSWSRNVVATIKTKLRRNRTGSMDTEVVTEVGVRGKCATLPARMTSLDICKDSRNKGKSSIWSMDEDDPLNLDSTKNDSDESVDSGFHPKLCDDVIALRRGSPVIAKSSRSSSTTSLYYDKAAVEKAFGPMKDVGRWYTTYNSSQTDQEDRYIHRPMAPIPLQSVEEEDERIASRPLPPLPATSNQSTPTVAPAVPARLVLHRTDDDMVYEHIQHKMLGSLGLSLDLRNLAEYGWYWGPITRVEAEERLAGAKDGTFLVRDSSDDRYLLSLSFHSQGKTLHTRIEYCNGNFSFYSFPDAETEGYPSVVELIQRSMQYSKDGVFCFSRARAAGSPAVPVRLLQPFSRFNHIQTLQHYCRFVIRQSIRFDKIRQLPLPRHVHGYLEQSQY